MRTPAHHAIPLLLTSSVIAHDQGVTLSDPHERKRHTLESVAQWLAIDAQLRIVLCDGSGYDFSDDVQSRFPQAHIECLRFENNQRLVKEFGRGYGEGEIVRYALEHSRFVAQAGCFAKCTAKLWVENYAECLHQWNGQLLCKGVFDNALSLLQMPRLSYIDTRFYIASVACYRTYFLEAHRAIDKDAGHGLEQTFLSVFQQHRIEGALFRNYPVIQGLGGGTGKYYKTSSIRLLKENLKMLCLRRSQSLARLLAESSPSFK
jgi:hypothetical protein